MILRPFALLLLILALPAPGQRSILKPAVNPDAAKTVVIFNTADADSEDLARYYAGKRGIPKDNMIGLKCPTTETITRPEYDDQIAEPVRAALVKRGLWTLRDEVTADGKVASTRVRYVALMRGIPLRIGPHFEKYEGDKTSGQGPPELATRNEAAVDSELSVLGVYTRQISGRINNPYFRAAQRFDETILPAMLLVCRIDASTKEVARRIIDDSLAAEARGLRGIAYIDARGTGDTRLAEGDKWLTNTADIARRKGVPAVLDNGESLFPQTYPMTHACAYFGWYAEHVTGPFLRPDFRFERGAIAAHIHSFSATTLRDPTKYWCAPLIAAGAAATVGNVYEPFLGLTPQLDVLFDRLRSGFTFAESAYMSQQGLSWQTTFVGDPLYRPWPALDAAPAEPRDEWEALRMGSAAFYDKGAEAGAAQLKAAAEKFRSGFVAEGLGLLQLSAGQADQAIKNFEIAATLYREPADVLRVTIHEIFQLKALSRTPDAIALARKRIAQHPKQPSTDILRFIEAEMTIASREKPQ
jgi:uncharacterized protein (TIGR03790 family)